MVQSMEKTQSATYKYPFQNLKLPLETRVNDLVSRFTIEEKINLMCQYQPAIPHLGIGAHKQGTEAAHGMAWLGEATSFPQPVGLACTWNQELMKEIGDVIGTEARAFYKKNPEVNGLTLWAPTVDMERDPRWGRTEEAYGEDPYLTGKLAAQLVKGIQGDHPFYFKAVATLKHFLANNNEIDRGKCSASIDPRNMHEYYLKPFELPFKEGGAYSMMTAYNSINGTPALLHPYVKEIVKEKWGMNGFIVSDAGDLLGVVNDHQYYESHAESVAHSIKNGIDSITDDAEVSTAAIREALERGLVSENDLDHALRNTFRVRFRLGEFDPAELNPYAAIPESVICDAKHSELSLQAAKESIVLLKNEQQTLPLNKNQLKKVAVIGPLGNIVYRDWYSGTLPYQVTPFEGIQKKLPKSEVSFQSGNDTVVFKYSTNNQYIGFGTEENSPLMANTLTKDEAETFEVTDWGWENLSFQSQSNGRYVTTADDVHVAASADEVYGWYVKEAFHLVPEENGQHVLTSWNHQVVKMGEKGELLVSDSKEPAEGDKLTMEVLVNGLEEAVRAAKEAETAIVFVGNNPLVNGKEEVDREDITLAEAQEQLIKEVYKVNPNTIVVIVGSYPFAINWVDENIPAILYTSHSGQELGNAVSDVLFGDYNPAGRLNMTWYKSVEQLPNLLDYDIIKGNRTYMYFDGEPLYSFGHGLSYAQFDYHQLQLTSQDINSSDLVTITFHVKNNSSVAGDEVVQLYVHAKESRYKRPIKQLVRFTRIHLEAGEDKKVEFTLPAEELAVWDVTQGRYVVESGEYELLAGNSSYSIQLTGIIKVNGEVIPARNLYEVTRAENYDDYDQVIIEESKEDGTCVYPKESGYWIQFADVNLRKGAHFFEARVATDTPEGAIVEIHLGHPDGQLIGSINARNTGSLQSWHTETCAIELEEMAELTDIYLVFQGKVQLSKFRFIV
jgi:beta-glucosidase